MSRQETGTPYAALKYTGGDGLDTHRAKWDAQVSSGVLGRRCDVPFSEQPKGRLAKSELNLGRLERQRAESAKNFAKLERRTAHQATPRR